MRGLLAGVAVATAGVAGLVVAWLPQSQGADNASGTLTASAGYVRPPAPPNTTAAVYFSVRNGTDRTQTLQSIRTDFAASAVVHNATMTLASFTVAPHTTKALTPGDGHVMAGQLYAKLTTGQKVHLVLTFAPGGPVDVTATVVGLTDPVPSIPGESR